jgi:CubicO group peptidase (beta-lactamase class C family)
MAARRCGTSWQDAGPMDAMAHDLPGRVDDAVGEAAAGGFSGTIRVEVAGGVIHESAHGFADRAHGLANTADTRIGIASGAKGFTALAVLALVEQGALSLHTTARSLLGDDLPLIDASVTVEQLLSHRSGIGDYLDEGTMGAITDYAMPVPVQQLACPADFLAILDGYPMVATPGERFAYNNGAFVVLSILVERATGRSYYDLVDELVCRPAGLDRTGFFRHDELPGDVALGYLHADGLRSNVLHVPVRGAGDGGIHTTAADISRLWRALFDGRIVSPAVVAAMVQRRGSTEKGTPYGLGVWLDRATDAVSLEGYDAGASFHSVHQPSRDVTWSVLSNTCEGAWPVVSSLVEVLGTSAATPTS